MCNTKEVEETNLRCNFFAFFGLIDGTKDFKKDSSSLISLPKVGSVGLLPLVQSSNILGVVLLIVTLDFAGISLFDATRKT